MVVPCTHGMLEKSRGGGAAAAGPCRARREPGDDAMVDGRRAQTALSSVTGIIVMKMTERAHDQEMALKEQLKIFKSHSLVMCSFVHLHYDNFR